MAAGTSHTTISIKLNEQGFHDIFNKYYVTLCLFANQYTENQETSADIVQDSFAKLWQIREDFFYLHQVKAFLYTAVRNKALNELWGIERSGFFNGRGKWVKGFENQRV